jgi:hypothetical protein
MLINYLSKLKSRHISPGRIETGSDNDRDINKDIKKYNEESLRLVDSALRYIDWKKYQ